ncbi:hypothetical protein ZHAS_00012108 [Anopheles sinensis]|uniref:Uncharacterized protein n=1 Tax=Anopheles sinensis TaxID=74873 RepID=A0A084W1X2_ANOSI|nr:hypothetical protein ZHAS_00012108 [Anopheles sinensis]
MNANSFWGTIDQLLGREAQKQSGQDSLKVAGWLSAYAGVRKSGGQGRIAHLFQKPVLNLHETLHHIFVPGSAIDIDSLFDAIKDWRLQTPDSRELT